MPGRYSDTLLHLTGARHPAARVEARVANSATLATLFANGDGEIPLANPLQASADNRPGLDRAGTVTFFADPAQSVDIWVLDGSQWFGPYNVTPAAATDQAAIPSGTYVDTTTAQTVGGLKDFATAPTVNGSPIGGSAPDASTTVKGLVKLAGDLAGTAALPTVPGLANKVGTAVQTVAASGAAVTLDASTYAAFDVTLTANCTVTFSGATAGRQAQFDLYLRQDATGSRTTTFPASVSWLNGITPVLPTAAASLVLLTFWSIDGGTTWFGVSNQPTGIVGLSRIVVPSGGQATIDWSSIPNIYDALTIEVSGRGSAGAALVNLSMRVNNDSTAIYAQETLEVFGATATGSTASAGTSTRLGPFTSDQATAGKQSPVKTFIPGYAGTTWHKTWISDSADWEDQAGSYRRSMTSGLWRSTAAINRVTLLLSSGSFMQGTVACLYGHRGA